MKVLLSTNGYTKFPSTGKVSNSSPPSSFDSLLLDSPSLSDSIPSQILSNCASHLGPHLEFVVFSVGCQESVLSLSYQRRSDLFVLSLLDSDRSRSNVFACVTTNKNRKSNKSQSRATRIFCRQRINGPKEGKESKGVLVCTPFPLSSDPLSTSTHHPSPSKPSGNRSAQQRLRNRTLLICHHVSVSPLWLSRNLDTCQRQQSRSDLKRRFLNLL